MQLVYYKLFYIVGIKVIVRLISYQHYFIIIIIYILIECLLVKCVQKY